MENEMEKTWKMKWKLGLYRVICVVFYCCKCLHSYNMYEHSQVFASTEMRWKPASVGSTISGALPHTFTVRCLQPGPVGVWQEVPERVLRMCRAK